MGRYYKGRGSILFADGVVIFIALLIFLIEAIYIIFYKAGYTKKKNIDIQGSPG